MKHYKICPNMEFAQKCKEAIALTYKNVEITKDYRNRIYVVYE